MRGEIEQIFLFLTRRWELREVIRAAVPEKAVEVISYGIPAFALPKPFFGYAAFKNHLSVLPFSGTTFDEFADDLKGFEHTKSSLHLPFDQPLPVRLIRKLVKARVASMNAAKAPKPVKPRVSR